MTQKQPQQITQCKMEIVSEDESIELIENQDLTKDCTIEIIDLDKNSSEEEHNNEVIDLDKESSEEEHRELYSYSQKKIIESKPKKEKIINHKYFILFSLYFLFFN